MIPERYKTPRAETRILGITRNHLAARLPNHDVNVPLLADYVPFALTLIEQAVGRDPRKVPPKKQWSRTIVRVIETAYMLDREELRVKFLLSAKLAMQLIPCLDEEDLRSSAVERVLRYVADPVNPGIGKPDGFFFTAARNIFRDLLRKEKRAREAALEMYRRRALREGEKENEEEQRAELKFPANEVRSALISFSMAKLRQQWRSRRTRGRAAERVRGFALTVVLMLAHRDLSRDECRVEAARRADAFNRSRGATAILVPPRATFRTWLTELNRRVNHAHDVG
jgi:DNA-directed RNA polymerase specialized sigma24 family protein